MPSVCFEESDHSIFVTSLRYKRERQKLSGWINLVNRVIVRGLKWLKSTRLRPDRNQYHGEFDPGSERTLAARLKHASRARTGGNFGGSGGLVSNAWITCLEAGDSR
jgi:hypothetical protein